MKVHLIATTNKTIKTMNPHDAKMEMLMEENSRLRRQLEAFMKEKNDDIENVFRNKLDHVRSSSRSIKKKDSKTNLSPRPAQALQQRKNQSNKQLENPSQNKCNFYLKNKNYIDSEASIKENMERNFHEQANKLKNIDKNSGSRMRTQGSNVQYLQSKTNIGSTVIKEPAITKPIKAENTKKVECFQQTYALKTKRRAIYEKQSEHNITKSLHKVNAHFAQKDYHQKPRILKKLRNTIYVEQ